MSLTLAAAQRAVAQRRNACAPGCRTTRCSRTALSWPRCASRSDRRVRRSWSRTAPFPSRRYGTGGPSARSWSWRSPLSFVGAHQPAQLRRAGPHLRGRRPGGPAGPVPGTRTDNQCDKSKPGSASPISPCRSRRLRRAGLPRNSRSMDSRLATRRRPGAARTPSRTAAAARRPCRT